MAEFVPTRLVRKAVSTAVAAAQGREMPERVEVLVTVKESPPTAGVPNAAAHAGPRAASRPKSKGD
jgi:hypothetical protein